MNEVVCLVLEKLKQKVEDNLLKINEILFKYTCLTFDGWSDLRVDKVRKQ